MTNNDVLRRIRYIFDLSDTQMVAHFDAAGVKVSRAQVSDWLKQDDDPARRACEDAELTAFLDGLINVRRGSRDGPPRTPQGSMSWNDVLRKLKIALDLQATDMLAILASADVHISKHELSALFRKPGHKHYRECQNQLLRGFLKGLQLRYREEA